MKQEDKMIPIERLNKILSEKSPSYFGTEVKDMAQEIIASREVIDKVHDAALDLYAEIEMMPEHARCEKTASFILSAIQKIKGA
jgi:hypothetical protein